ncbi:MAG: putative nucleotidyltransferase substrate binding domain-containing protein [Thioalkalispiraceae bacterium]|jgi:CBS domain-containing protein
MDIELQEIRDFLAQHVLFESLTTASLDDLVRHVTIRYLRRGQTFPPEFLEEAQLYLIRSGAISIRDEQGNLLEKLAEQDSYIEQCLDGKAVVGAVSEDSLIYHIPCSVIQELRKTSPEFDSHLLGSVEKRMRHAVDKYQQGDESQGAMRYLVKDLVDRTPVIIPITETVSHAAKIMTEENVSSALVIDNQNLVGMITDRDLRSRYIAKDMKPDTTVDKIMTTDLITVDDRTILLEALLVMTRNKIHHLPILKGKQPVGNLSVSDVIRHLGTNAAFIASDIEKANSPEALARISQRLPELHVQLVIANTSANEVGEMFSMITDAITCRLLKLAEQELGQPPVPYVWLAGGSQGRKEQTSHSDQDNALFIDDSMSAGDDKYFSALSKYVSDGLNACGYVYCPGNAMATNPEWRQPVSIWNKYFQGWIERPDKKALMLASIFFDLRPLYGEFSLFESVQTQMLSSAKQNQIFIAYMVTNALTHRPPLGFFRNFVLIHDKEHDNTLDVKHRGIVPIVDIARVMALSAGIADVNTTARLQAVCETGAMSREMSDNLIDALEYIASLRNHHQVERIRQGLAADNFLDPKSLSGLERSHLKDAFAIIKSMQEVLEHRYQAGRIA